MSLRIEPLRNMGAQVTGLDLSSQIPPHVQQQLREAWWRYGVLVFRGCGEGSHERQLRLSQVFGEDEPHTVPELIVPEEPRLIYVEYEGEHQTMVYMVDGELRIGWLLWHQDEAYTTNIPMGSLLRMTHVAQVGGETGFLDIARAYEDLPQALKARIENLKVLHQLGAMLPHPEAFGMRGLDVRLATQAEYPLASVAIPVENQQRFPVIESLLVVSHPYTGRKTMLLSPLGLLGAVGLQSSESDALLHELCERVIQDKYKYIHRWEPEDMVVWDNWTTMHMGLGYAPGERRFGYRTTIKGPGEARTGRIYSEAA